MRYKTMIFAVALSTLLTLPALAPARAATLPAGVPSCVAGQVVHQLSAVTYSIEPPVGFDFAVASPTTLACLGLPRTILSELRSNAQAHGIPMPALRYSAPSITTLTGVTAVAITRTYTTNWSGYVAASDQNGGASMTDWLGYLTLNDLNHESYGQNLVVWMGLDGWGGSGDVWQGGIGANTLSPTVPFAWYENFGCTASGCPYYLTYLNNFSVQEGALSNGFGYLSRVEYDPATHSGYYSITNPVSGVYTSIADTAVTASGSSAEAIAEVTTYSDGIHGYPGFHAHMQHVVDNARGLRMCDSYNLWQPNLFSGGVQQDGVSDFTCPTTPNNGDYFAVGSSNP